MNANLTSINSDFYIKIARIGRAVGLKGAVRLYSFLENDSENSFLEKCLVGSDNNEYNLTLIQKKSSFWLANISGFHSRTEVETIVGVELFLRRSEFPALPENEYYCVDLCNSRVFNEHGALIGNVLNVHNFGAGDILEINLCKQQDTIYYPLSRESVPEINLQNHTITILSDALEPYIKPSNPQIP